MSPTTRGSLPASAHATSIVACAEPTAAPDLAAGPTVRTGLTVDNEGLRNAEVRFIQIPLGPFSQP
jgi:hypothetical protein